MNIVRLYCMNHSLPDYAHRGAGVFAHHTPARGTSTDENARNPHRIFPKPPRNPFFPIN